MGILLGNVAQRLVGRRDGGTSVKRRLLGHSVLAQRPVQAQGGQRRRRRRWSGEVADQTQFAEPARGIGNEGGLGR